MFLQRSAIVALYVMLFALASIFLVVRQIPLSIDDQQYTDNFSFVKLSEMDLSSPLVFVEEPLWAAYCELLSGILSPEASIRVTIAISVLILGLVPLLLGGRGLVFYAFWFAFHPHLAPEIAFNQLRQGLALAVVMGMFAVSRRIVVPALIGALVHTSAASLGILAISRRHLVTISTLAVLLLVITTTLDEVVFLFGRRGWYLDEPIGLTLNYYIVNTTIIAVFGFLLYRHQKRYTDAAVFPTLFWGWFYLSSFILLMSVYLQFAPRFDYFSAYFLGLLLTVANDRADRGIFCGKILALIYLVLLNARLEYGDEANSPIRNWGLILGF